MPQIAGTVIRMGLMAAGRHSGVNDYQRDSWLWYKDVGYHRYIRDTDRLDNEHIPLIPWCHTEVLTASRFPSLSVSDMLPNTLYRSVCHNIGLCEFMCVNHEQKRVFLIQVTHQPLYHQPIQQHIVTIPTGRKLLEKLSMVGNDINPGYKLCLVRVVDWELASQHGFTFSEETEDTVFSIGDVLKLRTRKDDDSELFSDRLETFIVRACYFSQSSAAILNTNSSDSENLTTFMGVKNPTMLSINK